MASTYCIVLNYLGAREYIAYGVGVVAKFMHAPYKMHLDAGQWILRYLKLLLGIGNGLLYSSHWRFNVKFFKDFGWW